jgi:hypothetical protein
MQFNTARLYAIVASEEDLEQKKIGIRVETTTTLFPSAKGFSLMKKCILTQIMLHSSFVHRNSFKDKPFRVTGF